MLTQTQQDDMFPQLLEALKAYVDHYDDKLTEAEEEIRLNARDLISQVEGE